MRCPLNENVVCENDDVYGACFFCKLVNDNYAVSKIPILETDPIFVEDEDK